MRRASTRLLSHGTRFSPAVLGVLVVALGVSGYFIIASFAVATVTSAKSGNWSDAATWSGGKVPAAGDSVVVADGHTITYDANFSGDSALAGVKVNAGATLQFDPNKSATLQSTKNMVVEGVLRLRPGSVGIIQLIRFTGINEANFVGGGMNVLDSDVGLWVMGAGQLDVQGSPKTSWTRAAGAVAKGASSVVLASAPTGWQPGDELSIVPTEAPRLGSDGKKVDPASYRNFDETTVKSISGNTVNLNKATAFDHPKVNNTWTAEVMNLSRNARIEGTAAGQSHIFIRSTKPQTINHAELRHMGPRTGTDRKEFVLGRYGIHLHHSFEGSRGSIVDGTVIRDTESHAFVPHASHGVTFKNIIGYNLVESGFWWDHASETDNEPDSNDILVDGAILAKVSAPGNNDPAYFMVQGERNAVRNSVAVGMVGPSDSSGFGWPKGLEEEEVWDFTDNLSHNNAVHGMRTWMNDDGLHFIKRFAAYHNGKDGIFVGAYSNYFSLTNLNLYGNLESGVNFHAVSKKVRDGKPQLTLENSMIDGGGIGSALINAGSHNQRIDFSHRTPTIVRNVTLRGAKGKSIQLFHGNVNGGLPDIIDFIGTGLQPTDFSCDNITDGTRIRIQNDNTSALQLDKTCRSTTIQPFTTVSTTPTPPPPSPANTPPTVSLTAPAQNAAFTASATINLAATASDAGGSVAKVEFYQGTTKLGEDTTSPYGFSWANVPAGNYSLTARATDNQGAATVSSAVAVSVSGGGGTVDTTPPAKPTGVNATATAATRVELSWAANPSADGVVKYQVQRNGDIIAQPTGTRYIDVNVLPSTSYTYAILAVDGANNTSQPSSTKTVTTPQASDSSPPSAPTNLRAQAASPTQVNLSWTASTDNVAVAGYNIRRNGVLVETVTTTSFGESGLTPNTAYTYSVTAFDAAGNTSSPSNQVTVTTPSSGSSNRAGDVDGDGRVNIVDLSRLLSHWNTNYAPTDFNKDGTVNIQDLSVLLSRWEG